MIRIPFRSSRPPGGPARGAPGGPPGQFAGLRDEILPILQDVAESGTYVLGPRVAAFERAFAEYLGARHCVGVSSGTAALHLALIAADVGPGDEVITVPMTFVATSWAISYVGATPVFVDVDPDTYTMDVRQVRARITRRTRAVLPVHLYGQPATWAAGGALPRPRAGADRGRAQAHGAATAAGCRHRGAVRVLQLLPGQELGAAGEAGAVVTDDDAVASRMRALRDHAQSERYRHEEIASTTAWTRSRGRCWGEAPAPDRLDRGPPPTGRALLDCLDGLPLVLPKQAADRSHVWHLFVTLHRERDRLRRALASRGVQSGLHYPIPVHLQGAYRHSGTRPATSRCRSGWGGSASRCRSTRNDDEPTGPGDRRPHGRPRRVTAEQTPSADRTAPLTNESHAQIEYLGHAGFVAEHAGKRVLIDPGSTPRSWPPGSPTRTTATGRPRWPAGGSTTCTCPTPTKTTSTAVPRGLDRDVTVLSRRTGPRRCRSSSPPSVHPGRPARPQAVVELAPGSWPPSCFDTGHKEDSGLLLDMDGFRFLDLNDCKPPACPSCRPASTCWPPSSRGDGYPNCYDYRRPSCGRRSPGCGKTDQIARDKCRATGARAYSRAPGPPCFLDPELAATRPRRDHLPTWDGVDSAFERPSRVPRPSGRPGDRSSSPPRCPRRTVSGRPAGQRPGRVPGPPAGRSGRHSTTPPTGRSGPRN